MHTEALMGEATVMFLWGCVVHIYGAEWAALVQIQESMDVWFVTMKMHLECALRWSDCEWPWQTAVTDVDRNKSVMSELWGILLYTTSKKHWCVAVVLYLFWVCWWHTINIATTQKPQMLTIVCVWICVSLFPSGVFMTTIHHSSSHSPIEHAISWIYTHSLIIPTQIPYLSQPTTAEIPVKCEVCTWRFHESSIKTWKGR